MDTADIRELATAAWRLERWLDSIEIDRKMAAKSSLRLINKYLFAMGIEIVDPVGSVFDPGLAIDVIANDSDWTLDEDLFIKETVSPSIYENGKIVQRAKVVIGKQDSEAPASASSEELSGE